jgi:tol-pal system protein YbgF
MKKKRALTGKVILLLLTIVLTPFATRSSYAGRSAGIQTRIERIEKNQAGFTAYFSDIRRQLLTVTGQLEESNQRMEVLSDRLDKIEKSLTDIRQNVGGDDKKVEAQLEELSLQTMAFIRLMEKKNAITQRKHNKTVEQLRKSVQGLSPGETDLTRSENMQERKPVSSGMSTLYSESYSHFLHGDFEKAIQGFKKFLSGNRRSAQSENAAYWVGESYYRMHRYAESAEAFDSLVDIYPGSVKAPTALARSAHALTKDGKKMEALDRLRRIVNSYPSSTEAVAARKQLKEETTIPANNIAEDILIDETGSNGREP